MHWREPIIPINLICMLDIIACNYSVLRKWAFDIIIQFGRIWRIILFFFFEIKWVEWKFVRFFFFVDLSDIQARFDWKSRAKDLGLAKSCIWWRSLNMFSKLRLSSWNEWSRWLLVFRNIFYFRTHSSPMCC